MQQFIYKKKNNKNIINAYFRFEIRKNFSINLT